MGIIVEGDRRAGNVLRVHGRASGGVKKTAKTLPDLIAEVELLPTEAEVQTMAENAVTIERYNPLISINNDLNLGI